MRSLLHAPLALSLAFVLPACSGGGSDDSTGTDSSGGTDTDPGTTGTSTTGTSDGPTTTDSDTAGSTGGSTDATTGGSTGGTTGTGGSSGGSTGGGSTGGAFDCEGIPMGPFQPELVSSQFNGSEDIGFDMNGNLAGKDGGDVILVDSNDTPTVLAQVSNQSYGLRFMLGGDLLVARPQAGEIVRITPAGDVSDFATGLSSPNGIFPDLNGDVWVTEFGGSRVIRINGGGGTDTIVQGNEAQAANGVVYDPDRGLLFYTNYQAGRVARVPIDGQGNPGSPASVANVAGAPDGLALDICGNLYVVDQQGSDLYRIWLDDNGDAVGNPELIAEFGSNVANAQFGRGNGWDENSIYAAGNPGNVYRVELMVPGAPIP